MKLKILYEKMPSLKIKDTLRILHMSDIHANKWDKIHIDVWKQAQSLEYDIAVITGDLLLNTIDQIFPHVHGIRRLAAKKPLYFVDGNHDAFYTHAIENLLTKLGVKVLYNKFEEISVRGNKITIIGLRDYWYLERRHFKDIKPLFEKAPKNDFSLVLMHQPQLIKKIADYSPDLVLSGHTHGGQLRLPFLPTLYSPGQGFLPKYGDGWHSVKNTKLYISTGVGTTHFSLRTFNPPSVSLIEIGNF